MGELKRTQLYEAHLQAGGTMVDFGGWEMPVQYPTGIVAEHLYTRSVCSLFDVSHMGRLLLKGPERVAFLQKVLSRNVATLEVNKSQYCMIPDENGSAVDDAYLYRFSEDSLLLVVNASNTDKDIAHLNQYIGDFDCTMENITAHWASIAVQGPKCEEMLLTLSGGAALTAPKKNALNTLMMEGREVRIARTGYTGEPFGYEVFIQNKDAHWFWNRLLELGAKPAGLGARDTLRLEASMPLYGHEMGIDPEGKPMPLYAVSLSRFAVSFAEEKGDFIGKEALAKQFETFKAIQEGDCSDLTLLPRRIMPIALLDKGVIRGGMALYQGEKLVGFTTSGTMVPYYRTEIENGRTVQYEETGKRSVGLCYIDCTIGEDAVVEVDVRGRRLKAAITSGHMKADVPPYARPVLYKA